MALESSPIVFQNVAALWRADDPIIMDEWTQPVRSPSGRTSAGAAAGFDVADTSPSPVAASASASMPRSRFPFPAAAASPTGGAGGISSGGFAASSKSPPVDSAPPSPGFGSASPVALRSAWATGPSPAPASVSSSTPQPVARPPSHNKLPMHRR